jgi:hypothetical protein
MVRSVAEYLIWAEGLNAPRAKLAAENNIPVVWIRTRLTVSGVSADFIMKGYFISNCYQAIVVVMYVKSAKLRTYRLMQYLSTLKGHRQAKILAIKTKQGCGIAFS